MKSSTTLLLLASLTVAAVVIQGYHPGVEDDGVYLSAIQSNLKPDLFPHDSEFFKVQLQATIFDKLIAWSVRLTNVSLGWTALLWHLGTIFAILLGCWRISCRCFEEPHARWAAVTMVAALLSLPVAGTALFLVDQQLHPRALATALILSGVVALLDRRWALVFSLLVVAAMVHPIMGLFGASFCIFLSMAARREDFTSEMPVGVAAAMPLGWVFEAPPAAWKRALDGPNYFYLARWEWYEWLGALGPLAILWWMGRHAFPNRLSVMARICRSMIAFAMFQLAVAVIMLSLPGLERLRPMQPMRYLHLFYFLFVLLAGGFLGKYVLGTHAWRWLLLFVPLSVGMYYGQRESFPGTEHLALPGRASRNSWVEAFRWIQKNTPTDALFAIDPYYMRLPGEDYHSFRALSERSVLADMVKDRVVATQVPALAPVWEEQTNALKGWERFGKDDFEGLKARFGVNWVVLSAGGSPGMSCPYRNERVQVCRVE